jgi:hypothetical protein
MQFLMEKLQMALLYDNCITVVTFIGAQTHAFRTNTRSLSACPELGSGLFQVPLSCLVYVLPRDAETSLPAGKGRFSMTIAVILSVAAGSC